MYKLPQKIESLEPYTPVSGDYRIRLDANESFLPPSADVWAEAIKKAELNRYPDSLARELCSRFAEFYGIDENLVTAGNGSDELIFILVNCFLTKGDKVLTLSPDFSMYDIYASLAECSVYAMPKNKDLSIDVDAVVKELSSGEYKMIIFSNPCNPTSLGLGRKDVRRIIECSDTLVVLDEAYMDFWDQSLLCDVTDYDNLIILRTCSKMMGMAALRVGMAVACEKITKAIRSVKSPYNVNSLSQAVASAVLSEPKTLRKNQEEILESRKWLYEALLPICKDKGYFICESVTNFIFFRPDNAGRVYDELKKQGILIRCMGDYLRITAGTQEENNELIKSIKSLI